MRAVIVATMMLIALSAAAEEPLINADRPGIADSGQVLGRGVLQAESGFLRSTGIGAHQQSVPILLRYGLTDRFELRVDSDTFTRQEEGSGFGPVAIGAKAQLYDAGDQDFGFIGSVTLPSGSGPSRQTKASGYAVAAADVSLGGKWSANPNAGAALYHRADGASRVAPDLALTVEYDVTDRLHPAVEIARVPPDEGENDATTLANVQLAWIVRPSVQLDVEIGRNTSDRSHGYITAGVSVRVR